MSSAKGSTLPAANSAPLIPLATDRAAAVSIVLAPKVAQVLLQQVIPFPLANAAGHDRNILNFNAKNKNIFCIKNRK
ncbi:MAG: hypothetical protein FWG62_02735 [Proteobacteria bacterium]|nr:hypothetical protein [Pseudomonadota bacterium]